jgi:uncharacterized protein (DUF362 family)
MSLQGSYIRQQNQKKGNTMTKVMIHPASYENVRQAVDRAFEYFSLKLKNKRVLIKPNVLRASQWNEGIVTHPAVLKAVVEKIETMSPASIIVETIPDCSVMAQTRKALKKQD